MIMSDTESSDETNELDSMSDAEAIERSHCPPATLPAVWSIAAVRLLQGVVYHDDNAELWETLLKSVSPLADYFAKIGLILVVSESDGMAFLRQQTQEEADAQAEAVPRLFRRTPLGYDATLLCVLLRDALRDWEEHDVQNERCVVSQNELLQLWKAFFPNITDEVKLHRELSAALRKIEELKFVRQFEKEPPSWEIRRILKARLPIGDLEQLRRSLVQANLKSFPETSDDTNEQARNETE
jgi:hypothetical protein